MLDERIQRRRLVTFAAVAVLALLAGLVVLVASDAQSRALQRQLLLNSNGLTLQESMLRLEFLCSNVSFLESSASAQQLHAQAEECAEGAKEALDDLEGLLISLGMVEELGDLQYELKEVADGVQGLVADETPDSEDLAGLIEEVRRSADIAEDVVEQANGMVLQQARHAAWYIRLAAFFALGAAAGGLLGLSLAAFDLVGAILGDIDVREELTTLEDSPELSYRMLALLSDGKAEPEWRWHLELKRIIKDHPSHVTFEAQASHGDVCVPLWGKLYRWSAKVKALQRLFWPAYSKATWRALTRMHNRGINCPFPIIFREISRRRFPVGSIVLTEHVGSVEPLKLFLRTKFGLLSPQERRLFLQRLITYWNSLSAHCIHRVAVRYLHCTELPPSRAAEAQLFCFDLDKVLVSDCRSNCLHRWRVRRANARLKRWLADYLTAEEVELCRAALNGPDRGAEAEGEAL